VRAPSGWARDGAVIVEAPARLHFGMLDLRGSLGRRYGGIGAAVPAPSLVLEASLAADLRADGPDAERALEFARRFLAAHNVSGGARLCVRRAIPPHTGLGSGTQLALAIARALAELYGLPCDVPSLASAVGRGRRSGVGTWTFALGGFVLEGGRAAGTRQAHRVAPLLARLPFPDEWRCVVAVPQGTSGVSGEAEAAAFAQLPPPPHGETERVAHIVLMGLLPALADGDLIAFGEALTEVQRMNGRWFAPAQGGAFAPGGSDQLVRDLGAWGAAGVGQSSWGPAVYGIVAGREAGSTLADRARAALGTRGVVYECRFAGEGAQVWREGTVASLG
jgi:beta-ribofuranosylaminobenzene 5'-phosphate synthase